jgi:hypothetical protein
VTDAGAPLYVGSDGDSYGAGEVARKLADGEWRFCARDRESRTELFEVAPGELLALVPVDDADVEGRRRSKRR